MQNEQIQEEKVDEEVWKQMLLETPLIFYTVYANPKDFPGKFVVRQSIISSGKISHREKAEGVVDSLYEARRLIPDGLSCIDRQPEDQPQIVETWF